MSSDVDVATLDFRPAIGLCCRVTAPAETTGGAYVEMECVAEPGFATIVHFHPEQDESWRILSGELEFLREGEWRRAGEGESVAVPRGEVHAFRNAGDRPARFVNRHAPAGGFQAYLEEVHRLKEAGRVTGTKDVRSLLYVLSAWDRHHPDVPVRPPLWVARLLVGVGRRLGFRPD